MGQLRTGNCSLAPTCPHSLPPPPGILLYDYDPLTKEIMLLMVHQKARAGRVLTLPGGGRGVLKGVAPAPAYKKRRDAYLACRDHKCRWESTAEHMHHALAYASRAHMHHALMGKHIHAYAHHALAGGKRMPHEDKAPIATASREVEEETHGLLPASAIAPLLRHCPGLYLAHSKCVLLWPGSWHGGRGARRGVGLLVWGAQDLCRASAH